MTLHKAISGASLAFAAAALLTTVRAGADSPDFLYVPQTPSITLPSSQAGASERVNLFLQAQDANAEDIIAGENGLAYAGVGVTYSSNSGPGAASIITALNLDTTDFNAGFQPATISAYSANNDDEDAPAGGISFGNNAGGKTNANCIYPINTSSSNQIFLGTLVLTAGGAGSSTAFNIGEASDSVYGPGMYTQTATNYYDIDEPEINVGGPSYVGVGSNVSTFTLTVESAPEPASLVLMGVGGIFLLCRPRRGPTQRR